MHLWIQTPEKNKKALTETQTLRAGCSKVEPKISPRRRPLPRGAGRPKFNQLEMVTTFTYKPSLVRIDAICFVSTILVNEGEYINQTIMPLSLLVLLLHYIMKKSKWIANQITN